MHRIYRFVAIHCPVHDGVIGTRAEPLPMTYRSAALAKKLALRLEIQEGLYLSDEVWFEAHTDGQPYERSKPPVWEAPDYGTDEIPF